MKKFKNILKAMCLILAVACMSFAFAGCGEKGGEGIYEISDCRESFSANGYACYSLIDSCKQTQTLMTYIEKAEEGNKGAKRLANDIYVKMSGGTLLYSDTDLYTDAEKEKLERTKQSLVYLKIASDNNNKHNEFILDNVSKYAGSSFIAIKGSEAPTFVIHLNSSSDKFLDTTSLKPAAFIENAKGSDTYMTGSTAKKQGGFGENIVLIKNPIADEEKQLNRFDVVLGMNKSKLTGIYKTCDEYPTTDKQ